MGKQFRRYNKATGVQDGGRVQIAVRLDANVFAAINEAAKRTDVSVSEAIRRITRKWLKQSHQNGAAARREAGE